MANRQQRSNREPKKPKKDKAPAKTSDTSFDSQIKQASTPNYGIFGKSKIKS